MRPAPPDERSGATTLRWTPRKIDLTGFPDRAANGGGLAATIANVQFMLERNGITARYNVIKKKLEISFPGMPLTSDNSDNVSMTHVVSLAAQHGIAIGPVPAYVEAIADAHAYNPVAEWISGVPWDGVDRLPQFYATVIAADGYPEQLKQTLMRRWALSAVAAALMPHGFRCRGVLTFQGPQGIGKTRWGARLVSNPLLRDEVVKVDHHLDGGNKDSMLGAVGHWIVEVGELESSFRRDVSRLKGFLTSDRDKIRRPYARSESDYPRRTVFYATVNSHDFLLDDTGNSRWWTIEVLELDHQHDIDMQQLFAQLAVDFRAGEPWWLSTEEEARLERQNAQHRSTSVVADRLLAIIDTTPQDGQQSCAVTATELLQAAGFDHPSNAQAKECGTLLRGMYGGPRRLNGRDKWRVYIREADVTLQEPEYSQEQKGRPNFFD
ncbi:hypothetical protein GCM10009106_06770 [Sphingomonas japonica]